jgi:hypothetical protein
MSRATRHYRRWERQTAERAWRDARELALDLYYGQASTIGPYGIGVALEPGEIIYRQVWAQYSTLGATPDLIDGRGRLCLGTPVWRTWGWCDTLISSHRLVTRLAGDSERLGSNWWTAIGGVQVDLERQTVAMDDRTSSWRGVYAGPATPIIAVAAIERIHGPAALVEHPALGLLRRITRNETARTQEARALSRRALPTPPDGQSSKCERQLL